MAVVYFSDASSFHQEAQPFLLEHEAENSLLFGILDRMQAGVFTLTAPPLLALVREEQSIVGVAIRTPPRNVVLSVMSEDTAASLARTLSADGVAVPGVVGPRDAAQAFADAWCAISGQQPAVALREGVYALEQVNPPAGVSGRFRWAAPADRETLVAWIMAFDREALGITEPDRAEREAWAERVIHLTERGGMGIWEDAGQPVCFAGFGGRTPRGIRVAPVYTPPEQRGHGYASACTAALSQHLLDQGAQRCFLNTDLANSTSNKIYQAIGYRWVGEALEISFQAG